MQLNYLTNNILILNFKVDFPVKVVAKKFKISIQKRTVPRFRKICSYLESAQNSLQ